jgi:hypothetical protein
MSPATLNRLNWASRILITLLLAVLGWVGNQGANAISANTDAVGELSERMAVVETKLDQHMDP